jgi:hypothetical protein
LHGLGNVRQLEVKDKTAYIASREDGLFIIDVSDAAKPNIISRFDAVEFSTGVDVYGGLAILSCRHSGVHMVDISDLKVPRHVGILKVGEVQSVDVSNGYLYAGIWGTKEMVVCDIRNPYQPRIVTRIPVDGRGDGIFVKGNYCYAATGHLARGIKKDDLSDPAFGGGNGMEIYDISNPESPQFVSRIKINRFINMFYDMWDVTVIENYAFLSHTYNGVFVINVSDPKNPVFTAHVTLPQINGQMYSSPVGGIAITDDYIYAAGILSDLHVIEAPGLAKRIDDNAGLRGDAGRLPRNAGQDGIRAEPVYGSLPEFEIYKTPGQVYSVALTDGYAYAACGSSGIHILETQGKLRKAAEYATQGFAMDIKKSGNILYVAEGYGGLSIWKISGNTTLELIGRYVVDCYTIRQVVIPEQGKYAILQVASKWVHIVNIENPAAPELVFWDAHFRGQLFSRQISSGLAEGRYIAAIWHSVGYFWYDIFGGSRPKYSGYSSQKSFMAFNGIVCTPEHVIITHDKGYVLPDFKDGTNPVQLPHYGIKDYDLTGKPIVYGNTMFVSNRLNGLVTTLDISNITEPRLQTSFRLEGNPDIVAKHKNKVAIPAGYQGLLIYSV